MNTAIFAAFGIGPEMHLCAQVVFTFGGDLSWLLLGLRCPVTLIFQQLLCITNFVDTSLRPWFQFIIIFFGAVSELALTFRNHFFLVFGC